MKKNNLKIDDVQDFINKNLYKMFVENPAKALNIDKEFFEYEFVDVHDYSLNQLLNMNSMLSYALGIDKCKNGDEFLVVLKSLCNNITPDTRKDHLSMLITYGFKDFVNEDMRKKLLKKLKEGDVSDMKLGIEYVWEDIRRKEQKARLYQLRGNYFMNRAMKIRP